MRSHRPAPLCAAALTLTLLTFAPAAGCAASAEEGAAPPAPEGFSLEGADLERGGALFAKHCKVCHGDAGAGDGMLSEHLNPKPGDLQERLDERSPWEVYVTVRDGGKTLGLSPVMVGFGKRLSEQELKDVTAFTRTLADSGDE